MLLITTDSPFFIWFILFAIATFWLNITLEIRYRRKQKLLGMLTNRYNDGQDSSNRHKT